MKRTPRYNVLHVRVTDEEAKEIRRAADTAGTTIDALLYARIFGRVKC